MEEILNLLRLIQKAGGDVDGVLVWMRHMVSLGEDYATNGPARPQKDDKDGKSEVQYATLALKLLVASVDEAWEETQK